MDYFAERLQKLLDEEETIPADPLLELTAAQLQLFDVISKNNTDISLQIEEIYDIVKDADENAKRAKNAAKRESRLLESLIASLDLLEGLSQYMRDTGTEHWVTIDAKIEEILRFCGLEKTAALGQRLDPKLHTVAAAQEDELPKESIIRILESGYEYEGKPIRKATVIVSKGVGVNDCGD